MLTLRDLEPSYRDQLTDVGLEAAASIAASALWDSADPAGSGRGA
jgi:hypothetical protein